MRRRLFKRLLENRRIHDKDYACALSAVQDLTNADDETVLRAFEKSPNFRHGKIHHPLIVKDALRHLGWTGRKIHYHVHSVPRQPYGRKPLSVETMAKILPRGKYIGFGGGHPDDFFDHKGRLRDGSDGSIIRHNNYAGSSTFSIRNGRYWPHMNSVTHLYKLRRF